MAFTVVIQGNYGDEKKVGTTKLHPLGTPMVLPDGSLYRYGRAGGTALVAGKLYQGVAGHADTTHINILAVATVAAGANSVTVTTGGTAVVANVYADGYLFAASSTGNGIGRKYRVKSNASCAASSTFVVTLEDNETLEVGFSGGTTQVGLRRNLYDAVLLTTADTVRVNALAGVPAASCAASAYAWLQRTGLAAVFTGGTVLVVGQHAVVSGAIAGALAPPPASSANFTAWQHLDSVGRVLSVAVADSYALVDLCLE